MISEDKTTDLTLPKAQNSDLFVVGIGASAGGVETLTTFFQNTPADSGLAFVVILHLSPNHDSSLTHILQGATQMTVTQVRDKVKIKRDHVYVVSPNSHLSMQDGHIVPSLNMTVEDRRAPVDIFFRALAESHGARAIAVILSGTGANGSMGIKRIKERGGAAFVQNPREATYNEMPRNSIATELIDEVLNVADIPARIILYRDSLGTIEIAEIPEDRSEEQQQALREIFMQVRLRSGHDFTNYKRGTILRRIERRINIRILPDLPAYAVYLQDHPEETVALLKDLLISVTNFFRDKAAFEFVESDIFSKLASSKKEGDSLRIWTVGCATGEEAYSFAMLCAERFLGVLNAPKIQLFATDIDEDAIAIARDGLYTINDAADVSPERLRRFFTKEGEEYRVRREIRESILFASHNILKDPPFSRIDLITCRNMLIYLNPTGQERVMETFHFALNPGGYLFLGNSESADGATDLYATVNREHRVYQSRTAGTRTYPIPESVPSFKPLPMPNFNTPAENKSANERISYGDLHQRLLEAYAPPSVIINEDYNILHVSDTAGRYLNISGGEPSRNFLSLIREEFRLEVRSALYGAAQKQVNTATSSISLYINNKKESVVVSVRPVLRNSNDTARGFFLIIFEPGISTANEGDTVVMVTDSISQQLEEELYNTRFQLRTSSEQYELQTEEMKASNEELQALNEELRFAAEELETSKEELQSINEELRTVNQELKVKIEETSIASNNLRNFINSTDIGTLFLDRSLRVNLFTPAVRQVYNVIPSDYGRALADITTKLEYSNVLEDAEGVLTTLQPFEREVSIVNGKVYLMRIVPYRTSEDRISGVVISFIDISARKKADEDLRTSEERFRAFVTASSDAVYSMNADWSEMYSLKGMDFLVDTFDTNSNWLQRYIPEDERPHVQAAIADAVKEKKVFHLEHRIFQADHTVGWTESTAVPRFSSEGTIIEWMGAATNITDRKEAESRIREAEDKYRAQLEGDVATRTIELKQSRDQYYFLVENSLDMISRWDKNLRLVYANGAFEERTGVAGNDLAGKDYSEINQPDDSARSYMDGLRTAFETGEIVEYFNTYATPAGEVQYYSRMVPEKDEQGEVKTLLVTARDITPLRKAQAEVMGLKDEIAKRAEDKYEAIFNTIDEGFCIIKMIYSEEGTPVDWLYIESNPAFGEIIGENPVDKTAGEVTGYADAHLLQFYDNVVKNGETARTEAQFDGLDKWFSISATRIDGGEAHQVTVVYNDITELRKTEQELREREERKSYLLKLSDAVHSSSNADEIQQNIAATAMNHFAADRCYYCEFDEDGVTALIRDDAFRAGLSSLTRSYSLSNVPVFKNILASGEPTISTNVGEIEGLDEELKQLCRSKQIVACITLPLFKDDKLISCFCITQSVTRNWTDLEIELAKETAEHTWSAVEKVRTEEALQYSETKLRIVMKASGIGTWIWNMEENRFEPDSSTLDIFGNPAGGLPGIESIAALMYAPDMSSFADAVEKAADTEGNGILNLEFRIISSDGSLRWINSTAQTFFEGEPKKAVVMVGSSTDITERKLIHETLQQSEERYRVIVSQATAIVSEMDQEGNLTLANNAFCQSLGYMSDEVLSMNINDFTHPDDLERSISLLKQAVETGVSYTNEKRMLRNDGSIIWIAETITAIKDDQGKTRSVLAIGIDITERKKTEIYVHKSEERYRIALEAGELATWDWNLKTDKIDWNEQHFKLFGVKHEQQAVDPEYFLEFIYPEDIALVKQQLAEVMGAKGIYSAEFRIRRNDNGKLRWMTGYGRVTEREGNKPVRVSGVMFDSTERREAEENLEATKNSLNTALEAAKMGVWSIDMTHGYMDRSTKHDQLLGYHNWQEEWDHEKAKHFIIEEDKPKYDAAYANLLESGIFDLEARIKNVDGSVCWVHYFGRTFRNEDAKGETAAGVVYDITDQKTIEKQKDEFIGIASHELKTPVTSIKAYAEILQEMFEEANDKRSAELMSKLDSQVDRLTKLIRDLLDVTKVSEGQLHLVTRPFNLAETIKNTAEEMQRTTRSHTIRLSITELPEIVGDEERISQVIVNMMSNAIKYSPEAKEVFVTAKYEDGKVSVSVQDFGIGMSAGTLEKLFARFFRSDNPSVRSFPGLGLGLFISMEIMKRHGGTIAVQSEKGKGSLFTMILPLI